MRFRFVLVPLLWALFLGAGGAIAAPEPAAPAFRLSYALKPGESLRYKLTADIRYNGPILDNPEPVDWHILINLIYRATPKVRLADGAADVEFRAESADVEVEKVPLPLDIKQVQEVLDQTATLTSAGEVKRIVTGKQVPFNVSVPGVDPKRLFLLLFPIVFQAQPVRVGDNWSFQSGLLGGEGANASFSATVLPLRDAPAASRGRAKPKTRSSSGSRQPNAMSALTRLGEDFQMPVDQKLDAERKPVTGDAEPYRTRQGKIEGHGVFDFDRTLGRFTSGVVNIKADIVDRLVGKPASEDEPKQVASKVDARVTLELQPASAAPAGRAPQARKDK